jgi:hypothetical protein
VRRVQDPGQRRLRDAGGQVQVVQARRAHVLEHLQDVEAARQRLDRLDAVLTHLPHLLVFAA